MMLIMLCLLIGIVAGLRAIMAPALAAWGAHCCFAASGWAAFMGYRFTPWIFSLLALAELVTDQLPSTPSRKVPPQFGARIVMGGLSGATLGSSGGMWLGGLVAGVIGAVIGTLGGAAARAKLAGSFGKDLPAALIEDAVALIGGIAIIMVV